MEKTVILMDDIEERDALCVPPKKDAIDLKRMAFNSPTYFSRHMLGIRPQVFQHLIFKYIAGGDKRIAVCSSRQIGKSIGLAVLAVWAVFFNRFPSGRTQYDQNTKVVIISRDDEASKKLMAEIRSILIAGDAHMATITEGIEKAYFTKRISGERRDPNNKKQLSFRHLGCMPNHRPGMISCFPPTDAVRGNSVDMLIIDEAGYVDDAIYDNAIKPTVGTTGGIILLSSTPRGQHGFFFDIFDPFDKYKEHEFRRLWFPHTVCEIESQRRVVEEEKAHAERMGKTKSFKQEYEADFTVDEEAFFDLAKVDAIVDDRLVEQYEWKKTACSLGVDYGMTSCNTVLTIVTREESGKIILLYQHEFELGFDDNLLMEEKLGEHSIPGLMRRFDIKWIVPDNCAQGYRTNIEMQNRGYPVVSNSNAMGGGWNFRSDQADRNRGYVALKSKVNQGLIAIPKIHELIHQMKTLQAVDSKIYTSIRKSQGGKDDRVDSLMMACVPFTVLDDGGEVDTELVIGVGSLTNDRSNPRSDAMFNKMVSTFREKEIISALKDDTEETELWRRKR